MKIAQNRPSADEYGIRHVLYGTSDFVHRLMNAVLALEDSILAENRLDHEGSRPPVQLQSIDYIRQATEEVALTLSRLAEAVTDHPLDGDVILGPIKLDALRNCIAHSATSTEKPDLPTERNRIELF